MSARTCRYCIGYRKTVSYPLPGPPPNPADAIDGALERLDGLENVPLAEHVARFDAVHATLTDALSSIEQV
ncbi:MULTISPECIES: hypothetical protein [Lentzea]|uniref:hypothetical protein n=1 Tax=Lentzea sp. NPDC051838 TaxID=3154849 RepID=UPI0005EC78B0|nr:hypothetical protein [Lentzea aerocolonigenes]